MLIMIVLMFAVFYFFMIRPENKKKKQVEQMRSSLSVGDEITTIGAITAYQQAIADYTGVEDLYPYYQCGIFYGHTGNADRKIEMLSDVNKANPETPFYAEALYELGRSYLDARKDAPAAVAFEKLVRDAHDSTYIARGLIGLGTVAKNAAEYDKALDYYKKVVKTMPSTTWSADALLAIESIYQARQEPEKYLAYIESLGTGSPASEQDKEEMLQWCRTDLPGRQLAEGPGLAAELPPALSFRQVPGQLLVL